MHVFTPETRSFYGLERLWGDTPRIAPADAARGQAPAKTRSRRAVPRRA